MANNNINNTTTPFTRDNLSAMDKIFIPEDLDDNVSIEDLSNYKTCKLKFWRTVPENFRLVKVNRITQKVSFLDGFGLKAIAPIFVKTILVPAPILDGKHQYTDVECLSNDKIEISINLTIIMQITDPAKYKKKGSSQLPQLDSIIKRLLRMYVARKNFDELVAEECQLNAFDMNHALDTFEQECGIRVSKVIFEKVKLPERLKKLYNDAAEEEQRRKAQAVKLQAEKEKATAEAEIISIKANAEAKRIGIIENAKAEAWLKQMKSLVPYLISQNIPTNNIAKLIEDQYRIKTAAEGNAFISIGDSNNNMAANIAAGIRASNQATQTTNPSMATNMSNSERLINDAQVLFTTGKITEDKYKRIINNLKDPETKSQIDNCSPTVYDVLINNLIKIDPTNNEVQDNYTQRRR